MKKIFVGLTIAILALTGTIIYNSHVEAAYITNAVSTVYSGYKFVSTDTVNVQASSVNTTPTTMINAISGSKSIAANTLKVGSVIRVRMMGAFTSSATPVTFKLELLKGSSVISSTNTFTPTANLSATRYVFIAECIVTSLGVSGNIRDNGRIDVNTGSGFAAVSSSSTGSTARTVNTTTTEDLDVKVTFGGNTATNSIENRSLFVEIINP